MFYYKINTGKHQVRDFHLYIEYRPFRNKGTWKLQRSVRLASCMLFCCWRPSVGVLFLLLVGVAKASTWNQHKNLSNGNMKNRSQSFVFMPPFPMYVLPLLSLPHTYPTWQNCDWSASSTGCGWIQCLEQTTPYNHNVGFMH